jgi:hypothetical protein
MLYIYMHIFLQTHKLSNWLFTWMTLLDCTTLVLDVWELSMKHWNYNDMGNKDTNKLCPRSLVTVTNHYCDKHKHENSCHIFQNTYSHHQATHAECHAKRKPGTWKLKWKHSLEGSCCKTNSNLNGRSARLMTMYRSANVSNAVCTTTDIQNAGAKRYAPFVLENINWRNIRRRGPTISVSTAWH